MYSLALFSLFPFSFAVSNNLFTKTTITDLGTSCSDGSPAIFYTQSMSSDPTAPWLLWLDGPFNPLYSQMTAGVVYNTSSWPDSIPFTYGPFSYATSSEFATYSKSVLIYCSNDFYLGNGKSREIANGWTIMQSWLAMLKPQMSSASRIVAGGSTIGALGVVANFNLIQSAVPNVDISLLLDSPFFTPAIRATVNVNAIAAVSPAPSCKLNSTNLVYSSTPYVSYPCCLDLACSSGLLPTSTRIMILQSTAYYSSVNEALFYSSERTASYSDSQVYNLSLTAMKDGALVVSALRQAANDRPDATSYIAFSCVDGPILSPFGNMRCPQSGYLSTIPVNYLTPNNVRIQGSFECASDVQEFQNTMGDYGSAWKNFPSKWNVMRVWNSRLTPSTNPTISELITQWMSGSDYRVEEDCQGMNCNPTCDGTEIFLQVYPYNHIGFLTGLYMAIILGLAGIGLWIVYGNPSPKIEDVGENTGEPGYTVVDGTSGAGGGGVGVRSTSVLPDSSYFSQTTAAQRSIELKNVTYWNASVAGGSSWISTYAPPALKAVSLSIPQGSLVAIIGGSGAGKSTLLELMSGRRNTGSWTGEISVSGKPVTTEWLARNTGIVRQSLSPLVDELTLLQNLEFAAMLRVRGSREFILHRIDFVLNRLELADFKNSVTKTLSGGQRKRAEVALELLTQPDVLFLDEPTSALDSRTALNFMDWVAKVSKTTGSSIILSIHQPREEIWSLFTHVIILEQGFLVYYGPPFAVDAGSASTDVNPADLAVELAGNQRECMQMECKVWCKNIVTGRVSGAVSESVDESDGDQKKVRFYDKWFSKNKAETPTTVSTLTKSGSKRDGKLAAVSKNGTDQTSSSMPSALCQIRSFMLRAFAVNPPLKITTLRSVVGLSILGSLVALLLGAIFWSLDSESVRTKALAFLVLVPAFLSNSFVVSFVCDDMNIFFIERSNYYVTPLCFFTHHILHLVIYVVLPFTWFPFIQFFMLWGRVLDSYSFSMFLQMVGFSQICFVAFLSLFVFSCFFLKGKSSNAMIMNSSLESLFALFSGFLAPLPSLTLAPIRWLTYMSPAMWGYVGVTYALANVTFPGDCGSTSSSEVTCSLNQSGNALIYSLGFDALNPITGFVILVVWSVVFFLASWLVLARPWDKGATRLVVAGEYGEKGLEALGRIALVEQAKFAKSLDNFCKEKNSTTPLTEDNE